MSQEEKEQHLREGSEGKGNNQLCPSTERAISGVSATWVGVFKERLAPHSSGLLWKTQTSGFGPRCPTAPSEPQIRWAAREG